jgi:capsular exopolysaccharide synthesis family protein
MDRGLKTVVVTSAAPREGKTLTVVNLALTLSESYARRVLVIDADLRWPSVHRVLGITAETGLSEALGRLSSQLPLVEVSPLLSVLPAGHPKPNPLACLSSDRMQAVVNECASRFDWVLVDTPPVGVLADAQLLARRVQGVVFVIRAGATPFSVVERAIAELGRESVIGTVLNGVEARNIPAASLYGHHAAGR